MIELKRFEHLAGLSLYETNVTDIGLKDLKDCKNLWHLTLPGAITDEGMKELNGMRSLTSLSLCQTRITDAGLKELKGLANLRFLDLTGTQVTDVGLRELKGLKNLTDLRLRGTKVTGLGMMELSALKNLKRLDIEVTEQVTDDTLRSLRKIGLLHAWCGAFSATRERPARPEDFGGPQVTDDGLAELKHLTSLTSLRLA
jgi:internalin A